MRRLRVKIIYNNVFLNERPTSPNGQPNQNQTIPSRSNAMTQQNNTVSSCKTQHFYFAIQALHKDMSLSINQAA